jgi:hypothetical protein
MWYAFPGERCARAAFFFCFTGVLPRLALAFNLLKIKEISTALRTLA